MRVHFYGSVFERENREFLWKRSAGFFRVLHAFLVNRVLSSGFDFQIKRLKSIASRITVNFCMKIVNHRFGKNPDGKNRSNLAPS